MPRRKAGDTRDGVPEDEPHDDEGLDEQVSASTLDLHDLINDRHLRARSGCELAMFLRSVFTTAPILEILKCSEFSLRNSTIIQVPRGRFYLSRSSRLPQSVWTPRRNCSKMIGLEIER